MTVPRAVWVGTFTLFGVPLRCSVLDTGERVIDADDVERLFEAMGDDAEIDVAELERFARWRAAGPGETP